MSNDMKPPTRQGNYTFEVVAAVTCMINAAPDKSDKTLPTARTWLFERESY
jgi:hypothetical protein